MLATAVHEAPWESGIHEVKDGGFRLPPSGARGFGCSRCYCRQRYETLVQNVFVTDRLGPSSGWKIASSRSRSAISLELIPAFFGVRGCGIVELGDW